MQHAKRIIFYCLHKVWLVLALALVLLAVVISILRYTLPHADGYKHHIEQLIHERYGAHVRVGEISAGWQKFGPALLLKNLQLLDDENKAQLSIAETRVRVNFWRSLTSLQLTAEHFELDGLNYYLDAKNLFNADSEAVDSAPFISALEQLFFSQLTYFSVVNSQLILQNEGDPDLILGIKKLDWANSDERHQGYGELALTGVTANTVSFILDLHGKTLNEAEGHLYFESDKLNVLPWFKSFLPPSQKLEQALIDFKAWGQIRQGLLQQFQIELAKNTLSWQRDDNAHSLELGPGQLLWQPSVDGWRLTSGPITMSTQDEQWQGLKVWLASSDDVLTGGLANFPINAVTPLANLLAEDISALQHLVKFSPKGDIEQFLFQLSDNDWQLQSKLVNVSSKASGDIPGVSNVTAEVLAASDFVSVTLDSLESELTWDGFFATPIQYRTLSAQSILYKRNESWVFSIPSLSVHSDDFQLDASLAFNKELRILAKLQQLDAAKAKLYYPKRYMPEGVSRYLSNAIKSGQVPEVFVLWHGKPADYPYVDKQGVFQVLASLEQGVFSFADGWPLIENLSSELWFENAYMGIQSKKGVISNIDIADGVYTRIPDLLQANTLFIDISQKAQAEDVTALFLNSSLRASLGEVLEQIGAKGLAQGEVELAVDLHNADVVATGLVKFEDAQLHLKTPNMHIANLNGVLHFKNEKIKADNLTLSWRDLPITASIKGGKNEGDYQLLMDLNANQATKKILESVYAQGVSLVDGNTAWQAKLELNLGENAMSYQAQLQSDLYDTAMILPAPFAKKAAQSSSLLATVTGNNAESAIAVEYGKQLNFSALLDHNSTSLTRAHLSLGNVQAAPLVDEFIISLDLAELDFIAWFDLVNEQLEAADSNSEGAFFPELTQVKGKVAKLDVVPGIVLHNTLFEAKQLEQEWQLQLNGNELASRFVFHKDWKNKGLSASFDYLHLPIKDKVESSEEAAKVTEQLAKSAQSWLLTLPPISVSCADCSIGTYRLGQVEAKASVAGDRWNLTNYQSRYKGYQLNATGFWQQDGHLGHSHFTGDLSSNNLGNVLSEFELTSAISGSSAAFAFTFDWQGAPQQFSLPNLGGKLSFDLGAGSLTEVSDQGARLLSLFSLDSLLRKLRLDFRDVFSKGFFYNSISGNVTISEGVAHTNDAKIDGVPGNIQIQGYTDLVDNDVNYQMAFSPKVTSSLPIIIAWMVNPATGLAALALDEVFESAEVISKINFTITGSLDNPVVTEVNRHSTEVPVPVRVAKPDVAQEPSENPQYD